MPSFEQGTVTEILGSRRGLQRVAVDLGRDRSERAYVLTQLTGEVAVDNEVIVNTTAVELGLGTGGWHVVHWNLSRRSWSEPGPGHILKARYTSLQTDVGSAEEHWTDLADVTTIEGLPVVAAGLHSQVPAIAVAVRTALADARIAYVMTDGAALPLALSDLVHELRTRSLLDATITCGHAFGGDHETVTVHSALAVAAHIVTADVAIVAMGPGIVGTATRLGFSGIEVGSILDAAAGLGGEPIACVRASEADARPRHRDLSHHTLTALTVGCRSRVTVAVPLGERPVHSAVQSDIQNSTIASRHDVALVQPPPILDLLSAHGLAVTSMGRRAAQDAILFEAGAVAGLIAADRAAKRRDRR